MRAFVETAGRTTDYAFLGPAPERLWWLGDPGLKTAFEGPTVVVRRAGGCQVYVGGIPSGRVDHQDRRRIRFNLVFDDAGWGEGVADGAGVGEDAVLGLLAAWLADAAEEPVGRRVQAVLDGEFTEAVVEDLLARPGAGSGEEVRRRLGRALGRLEAAGDGAPAGGAVPGRWFGSLRDPDARRRFLGHAAAVLAGAGGEALLLNLVRSPAAVPPPAGGGPDPGATVVLARDPTGWDERGLVPLPRPKKVEDRQGSEPLPVRNGSRPVARPGRAARAAIAAGVVALALALLLPPALHLARRTGSTSTSTVSTGPGASGASPSASTVSRARVTPPR